MVYRVIGTVAEKQELILSFAEFGENAGVWNHEVKVSAVFPFPDNWKIKLETAADLSAVDYQFLHVEFGRYAGQLVKRFIEENSLHYQVALVSFSGYTCLYQPGQMMSQLGSGAAVAAEIQLPVVTDLPVMDIFLGGSGKFTDAMAAKINLDMQGEKASPAHIAVCVALMGILRWREEYNFLSSATGACRSSIGGAVWLGQDA